MEMWYVQARTYTHASIGYTHMCVEYTRTDMQTHKHRASTHTHMHRAQTQRFSIHHLLCAVSLKAQLSVLWSCMGERAACHFPVSTDTGENPHAGLTALSSRMAACRLIRMKVFLVLLLNSSIYSGITTFFLKITILL